MLSNKKFPGVINTIFNKCRCNIGKIVKITRIFDSENRISSENLVQQKYMSENRKTIL